MKHLIVGSKGYVTGKGHLVDDYRDSNLKELDSLAKAISKIMGGEELRILYSTESDAVKRTAEIMSRYVSNSLEACSDLNINMTERDWVQYHNKSYRKEKLNRVSEIVDESWGTPGLLIITNGVIKRSFPHYYTRSRDLLLKDAFYEYIAKNMYCHMDFEKGLVETLSGRNYK